MTAMGGITTKKVLNNNVVIAQHPQYAEVVVIGKGIGFHRKAEDIIPIEMVEKMFILRNREEQEQYKELIPQVDEKLIEVVQEIVLYVMERTNKVLNEHIHIAMTDHISFAIRRYEQSIIIHNPFLQETKGLYPDEFHMAEHAIARVNSVMSTSLPEDEIGFITLHIVSAMNNQAITEVKEQSQLISDLVRLVEKRLDYQIPRKSLDYSRFITHLRFLLERLRRGEIVRETSSLDQLLKREYFVMYDLAWKLTKVIQRRIKIAVYPAEVTYLTLHLQRLAQNKLDDERGIR